MLIVSYNTRQLLAGCLRSIAEHGPPAPVQLRVSVLDNASRDGSAEMVARCFPEVRLIRSAVNLGFARANNVLAATSDADYLLLLNPDTRWIEDVITPLVSALEGDPEIAVAGPRLVGGDGRPQLSSQGFPTLRYELALHLRSTKLDRLAGRRGAGQLVTRLRQEHLVDDRRTRETDFLWATCWLLRRMEFERAGIFDERFDLYDEDLDLCRRLRRGGRRIAYCPGVSVVHLGGASSAPSAKRRLMRRARARFYAVHHGPLAAAAYLAAERLLPALKRVRPALAGHRDQHASAAAPPTAGGRVLVVGPGEGGVSVVAQRAADALAARGWRVRRLRAPGAGAGAPALEALRMLVSERRALRSADVVHVEFGSLDGACFWFGLMAALLRDDVVAVVHDPPLMALAPGAALIRTGTRWRDVVGHRLLAPLLDGCLRRAFARRVAVGVTLSEPGRRAWVGPAPSRLQVLDLGADPPSAGAPPPSAGAHVLFAGFIAPGKGIEVLLEAWAQVGRSTRLPLVIAGDETPGPSNGYRASLQESSRRLASPPRWLGAVNDEEFASLVSRAAIVVLPYLRSNPASGVLVRAMVEGRAIVASRVPAALDALTDGGDGLLVPVGEAAPLADALAGLLADGALRDRLGAAAAARATGRFTWERHTAGLERAYRLAGAR